MKRSLFILIIGFVVCNAEAETHFNPWESRLGAIKLDRHELIEVLRRAFESLRNKGDLTYESYFSRLNIVLSPGDAVDLERRRIRIDIANKKIGVFLSELCIDQGFSVSFENKTLTLHSGTGFLNGTQRDWFVDTSSSKSLAEKLKVATSTDERLSMVKEFIETHHKSPSNLRIVDVTTGSSMIWINCSAADYLAVRYLFQK